MDPAVSRPERRRRSEASAAFALVAAGQGPVGRLHGREELLVLGEETLLPLELGLLAGAEPRLRDLVDGEAQEVHLAAPLGLRGQGRLVGALLGSERGEAGGEGADLVLDASVAVEELAMILGQEEGLVLVLAVEIDQEGSELGEIGAERALILDVGRSAPVRLDPPADEDPALLGLETPRAEPFLGLGIARDIEDAGHEALLGPRADHSRVRLGAEEKADGARRGGTCPRLSRPVRMLRPPVKLTDRRSIRAKSRTVSSSSTGAPRPGQFRAQELVEREAFGNVDKGLLRGSGCPDPVARAQGESLLAVDGEHRALSASPPP